MLFFPKMLSFLAAVRSVQHAWLVKLGEGRAEVEISRGWMCSLWSGEKLEVESGGER